MLFAPFNLIEMREVLGQQVLCNNQHLPKYTGHTFPKCTADNIYNEFGIKILDEIDNLFYSVELPEGWSIRPTNNRVWSELVDAEGRIRADIFYKDSPYDRDAFIVLENSET